MSALINSSARSRRAVTFVLPGDSRSGGVRVTAIMANLLLERGHHVRIVHSKESSLLRATLKRLFWRDRGGFLHIFRGPVETFEQLDHLNFQPGEVVIAVGTYTVTKVRALKKPVIKVRFNHGFPAQPSPEDEKAWCGPMTTITVSKTLLPRLRSEIGVDVWGVVPNGVDTDQYFVEQHIVRDGIGALYGRHPNKAPEDLITVLRAAHERWPDVPQYVFGTEPRPSGLKHTNYTRFPSVDAARQIYNRSLVWLVTSRTEGLPGVVLEALACGCAVVSSDNDGSLEIVENEKNGLIVNRGDRDGFCEAIGLLLADKARREQIAAAGTKTAMDFSWPKAADRMEEFLSSLSSDRPGVEVGTGGSRT